jgi:hypothetical protein
MASGRRVIVTQIEQCLPGAEDLLARELVALEFLERIGLERHPLEAIELLLLLGLRIGEEPRRAFQSGAVADDGIED